MSTPSNDSEMREKVSKTMGWWSPAGFDAYPEKTDKVMQLFAQHLQLAELKTRVDEAEEALNRFSMLKEKPDSADYVRRWNHVVTTTNDRITALNEQIKGLS